MNDKDLRLMAYLKESIGEPAKPGPILLDVKSTQFVRINLLLLKALSPENGMPGIFIAIDRPHQYMVHLLTMHQINSTGLVFLDAISRFSADTKTASAKVGFVHGPSHVDELPNAIREWSTNANGNSLDMQSLRFAMIDNLAALLTYNSYSSVELFLRNFVGVLSTTKLVIPFVVDKERNCVLYEMVRSLCENEISVNENAIAGMGGQMPPQRPQMPQQRPNQITQFR
ncbi:MAG: hypothetical protein A4E32_01415 [Methanomassiliicoccales archaeon PtaU1.Bin124]|nr:MAG: hypothetical protein A4E32_01415 [Methanomassiliicoccales archaeon PtaU1.Bin124]